LLELIVECEVEPDSIKGSNSFVFGNRFYIGIFSRQKPWSQILKMKSIIKNEVV